MASTRPLLRCQTPISTVSSLRRLTAPDASRFHSDTRTPISATLDRDWRRGSRSRLTANDTPRFRTDSVLDQLARVVCELNCIPRKVPFDPHVASQRLHAVCMAQLLVESVAKP
jgi:hypothetical protein